MPLANKQVDELTEGDRLVGVTGTAYRLVEVITYGEQDVRPCVCEIVTDPPMPHGTEFTRSDTLVTTHTI